MVRIGTRGSRLALWQANDLKDRLEKINVACELVIIKTKGDIIQHLSFDKIEGKGFFTKEIEDALLVNEIDVAVHSLKDLPTSMTDDLVVSGVSARANPSDILIIHPDCVDKNSLIKIRSGATVGTSSIRRKVQLRQFAKDVHLVDIRGNVPTRVNKVRTKEVDAVILAAAGIDRLQIDLSDMELLRFNPLEFVPSPAQGVIAYQCRKNDKITRTIIQEIHNSEVSSCTNVERKVLQLLDGGCQLPLGAYCTRDNHGHFHCTAALGKGINDPVKRVSYSQSTSSGMARYIVDQLTQ